MNKLGQTHIIYQQQKFNKTNWNQNNAYC